MTQTLSIQSLDRPDECRKFFQQMILTGLRYWENHPAIQQIDVPVLDRERAGILNAVQRGLEFGPAWPVVRKLIEALASFMERRGYWAVWRSMLEKAIATSQRVGDLDGETTMTALLARLSQRQSKGEDVVRYYRRVMCLAKRSDNQYEFARACCNLGYYYIDANRWWRAEVLSLKALEIFEELGSEHGLAHTHNHLGVLYTRQRRRDDAERHLLQAYNTWEKINDFSGIMRASGNIGLLYLDLEQPADVIKYSRKACTLADQLGEEPQLGFDLMNIGMAYNLMNDATKARTYVTKAEQVFKQFENRLGLAQVSHNLGIIAITEGNWADSQRYFLEALKYYQTHDNIDGEMKLLENIVERELASQNISGARKAISEFEFFVAKHMMPTQRNYIERQLKKHYQHLDKLSPNSGNV